MTWWLTVERWENTLGLSIDGCCVVSDCKLISILSSSVEPLEMSLAETVVALGPWEGDLKADNLMSPFLLMCVFKKLNLSRIQFCLSVISLGAWPDLDWMRFP